MPSAKPLYSAFDKALESLLRNKGTGSEFLGELTKKAGVKQAEIQERGLDKALGSLPKVDKATVQKVVQKNPPARVEVKTKYNDPTEHPDYEDFLKDASEREDYRGRTVYVDPIQAHHDAVEALGGYTKYHEYQLPDNENYREMLLTLPSHEGPAFQSQHWDEPNVLAHMRISDRIGPNNEKVLHLEELQSDWHQQGRDKGYGNQLTPEDVKRIEQLQKMSVNGNISMADRAEWAGLIKKRDDSVPDAPFKKNWEELALKHLVNHAVENGYDKIAITPGAVQADRYDLSKKISKVKYFDEPNSDKGVLHAYDLQGNNVLNQSVPKEKVQDYIGKDAAQKLLDQPAEGHDRPNVPSQQRTLSGLDLQVGGEGMKAAYDQRIPSVLNKIGKPYGAQVQLNGMNIATPQTTDLSITDMLRQTNTPEQAWLDMPYEQKESMMDQFSKDNANKTTALHSFDITPEMKQQVQTEGLPKYRRGGKVNLNTNPDTHWAETQFKRK